MRLFAILFVILTAGCLQAATVDVEWTSVDGNAVVSGDTVSWGQSSGEGQSSFTVAGSDIPPDVTGRFTIASITHFNRPIYFENNTPDFFGATFSFSGAVGGDPFFGSLTLSHNETPNGGNCEGFVLCPDVVMVTDFSVTGIDARYSGPSAWLLAENNRSTFFIDAAITPVPLPATALLLLSALFAMQFRKMRLSSRA